MTRERVRFGVDLDRETDAEIRKLAVLEQRSKRNMNAVLMMRIIRLWKAEPQKAREFGLVKA